MKAVKKKKIMIAVVAICVLAIGVFLFITWNTKRKYQIDRKELLLAAGDRYLLSFNAEDKSLDPGMDMELEDELKNLNQRLTWCSSDESVAEVTENGYVKAKKMGETIIKGRMYLFSYECKVTVVENTTPIDEHIVYNNQMFTKEIYENTESISLHLVSDIDCKDAYYVGKIYAVLAAMEEPKFEEDVTQIYSDTSTMPLGDEVIMINLRNGESVWVRGKGKDHFVLVKNGKSLEYSYTYSDERFGTNYDLFNSLRMNIGNSVENGNAIHIKK